MLVVLVRMLGRAGRDLLVQLVVHPSTGGANLRLAEWVGQRRKGASRRGFVKSAEGPCSRSPLCVVGGWMRVVGGQTLQTSRRMDGAAAGMSLR